MINFLKFSVVVFFCLSSPIYAVVHPLLRAAMAGNIDAMIRHLDMGADPNMAIQEADLGALPDLVAAGDTSLHILARNGNYEGSRRFIEHARSRVENLTRKRARARVEEAILRLRLQRCSKDRPGRLISPIAASGIGILGGMPMIFPASPRRARSAAAPTESVVVLEAPIPLVTNPLNANGDAPIHEAIMGGFVDLVLLLGGAGGAQGLHVLDFHDEVVADNFVPALVAALPFFADHLQILNLNDVHLAGPHYNLFGPTPLQQANHAALGDLEYLVLPQLVELHLAGIGFGGAQMLALHGFGPLLAQVHVLDLGNNGLGNAGAIQLAALMAANLPQHLTHFSLNSNGIGGPGFEALAPSLAALGAHNSLQYVDLSGNELDTGGVADLVPALGIMGTLSSLDLGFTNLGHMEPGSPEAEAEGLDDHHANAQVLPAVLMANVNLQDLLLNDNQIEMPFMQALGDFLADPNPVILPQLLNLNLAGNFADLDDADREQLNAILARIRARRPRLNIILEHPARP